MEPLTLRELLETKGETLALELLTSEDGLGREIPGPDVASPGLVLVGFTERFPRDRLPVLGETEITFLHQLKPAERERAVRAFVECGFPAVFITKGLEPPEGLIDLAQEAGIPVVRSDAATGDFYRRLKPFLEERFSPATNLHGSLADIYGVGVLFVGQSGIGKSETVLDLVERGHRLVADDLIHVVRRGNDVLIGRGHELQQHHMEIRGIGIIDIRRLFGIRAVRQQKRIEVVVQLEVWDQSTHYDRTGLDTETAEILGVELPRVVVPLNPGKNITVISEVVAMNHLLKYSGVDTALRFNERLRKRMRGTMEYLEQDYE